MSNTRPVSRSFTLQIPSNLTLAYIGRPHFYLPACVATWGVVSGLSAVCDSFTHLLLVRLFLGVVEAAFFPGALYLLSRWYTRKEIPSRMALLYGGSILSNAVSGLIAAGILGNMDGSLGIRGWKWLFIIEGSVTVFVALCAVFILPDFPHNSSMLSAQEKELAIHRLALDAGQTETEGVQGDGPIDGLKQAVRDPIVWLFALCLTACTIGVAFNQ
jgi:MFS family permease